jgi:hydrogenase expression/formation protein HypC
MCLGVPGRILSITTAEGIGGDPVATVDFQGSRVEVSLALVPAAKAGDWVLVHAGFALTLLDEAEAAETWRWLDAAELAGEMSRARPLSEEGKRP